MELTQGIKGHAEPSMRRVSRRKILAIILGAVMVLLVTSTVLFGVAIQRRAVAPPELDMRLGRLHLVAYATHTPDCARYLTSCPPELITLPAQDYYVFWVLTRTGQVASPDERETGTRVLTLPLHQLDAHERFVAALKQQQLWMGPAMGSKDETLVPLNPAAQSVMDYLRVHSTDRPSRPPTMPAPLDIHDRHPQPDGR
jgi:hypothetical protein